MRTGIVAGVCAAVALAGCGPGGSAASHAGFAAPVTKGAWTFWGKDQGLSDDVQDVSPDEGGNVYVAGGSALYAKGPTDQAFLRFDATNAGLTKSCNDDSAYYDETPAKPFFVCRVLAVAGAAPGKAIVGYDAASVEPQKGANWTYHAGGADVVAFDATKHALTRTRHVWFASPPHTICTTQGGKPTYGRFSTCDPTDYWWQVGRRMTTRLERIVVNHDKSSPMYGDAWVGGHHATLAALLSNPGQRAFFDRTAAWGPEWTDAKDVWEHEHPNLAPLDGSFVNGEGWGISIDPRDGRPWGTNEYRITRIEGPYGADLSNDDWWEMMPYVDPWPDPAYDPSSATYHPPNENIRSLSHCADGTLWIGSLTHGLSRIDPSGVLHAGPAVPDAGGVGALACDPTDSSLWIGLYSGGLLRLRNGSFERIDTAGWPGFTGNMVQSIQIDRWSKQRTVWFAFSPITDGNGTILKGGGVGSYSGP